MANHRCFSRNIIGSYRFISMQPSTRELYFELGMYADDDGIVEAGTIMGMYRASIDDLRVLAAKGFITILNEDYVALINDWKENNYIRESRYRPSIYHDLLVRVTQALPPISENEATDVRPMDGQMTANGRTNDGQMTANGRTNDGQCTANVRPMDGLSKDKISKDKSKDKTSEGKVSEDKTSEENISDPTSPSVQSVKQTKKANKFIPPTEEEVRAYCDEKGYDINVTMFWNFYEANGWVQGKGKPIKDWKRCVVTWVQNKKEQEHEHNAQQQKQREEKNWF